MEKFVRRPTEEEAADNLIGPGIQSGALKVLQNLPYVKRGKPLEHVFDCELGDSEREFVLRRIHGGDRSTDVQFEPVDLDGHLVTRIVVVKGRR